MSGLNVFKQKKIIFCTGKGGVGKTSCSKALALSLSNEGRTCLWICFEDSVLPKNEKVTLNSNLTLLNCTPEESFEEYISLKTKIPFLAKTFTHNKLVKYLAKAAPGVSELVMLGKVWHERIQYDHVIVDMPSSGYTLSLFQSVINFSKLFKGSPLQKDALSMLTTFSEVNESLFWILSLPEETPIQESLELKEKIQSLFSKQNPLFTVNRVFPSLEKPSLQETKDTTEFSVQTKKAYIQSRTQLEESNLNLYRENNISFSTLPFVTYKTEEELSHKVSRYLSA